MKTEKLSIFISIVLISILALGAVSAADDTAIADDASDAVLDEVQTIDNTITNDDISYESTDIIVNDTGDSADSKVKTTSLSANAVNEGETLSFTQLAADVSSSPSMLSGAYYKYDPSTDTAFENGITLTNGLTIIGGGATIDGDNQARIFNIPEGVSVTIMGVTLINGAAEEGAAIYNSGKLTLMNAKVNDNTAVKSGGGIYNNGGEVLVTSSEFDGNDLTDRTVNGYGGAAIYSNGGSVTITDTNVTNNLKNIVHRGGTGTYTGDLSSAAVTSNNADLTVTNSRFIANSGSYGGAIYSGESTSANLLVSGSTFEDNFAFNGGAIDIVGTSYTISDSTFKNNNVKGTGSTNSNYASGGAICVQDANNPGLISGCDFEANSGVVGGAVNCENTMVLDCTFTDNTANSANSETFNGKTNNRGGFAGAIYNEGTITISDCEFDDNAGRGEGIRVKNAEISDSSFTNTRIDTCQNSNVLLTNNTYNNPDRDVQAASGTQVTVDVADGDIPNANTAPYIVGDLTFTDLQALIDSGSSGIRLTGNVIKTAEEETTFADGLNVDKTVTIYGAEGKVIQANSGKIFNVAEGKTLTLRNATLQGSGETAITNYGTVHLYLADNNQFTDCGDVLIDNHGRTTETGLTTFTQLNNLIGLVNGGTVDIGESKITKAEDEKEAYKNGIVIDKDLSILGSYNTYYKYVKTSINANNDGRIFTVAEGKSLSLKYINVTNGTADEGAGVYVSEDATLIADTANFIENIAVTKGGAIYSEGTVDLKDSVIKENYISKRDGAGDENKGGAALYNKGGTATLDNVTVVDNLKDYVNGDVLNGAVVAMGKTTITNSNFTNNYGRYGGAITQTETDETLTVENTIFEDNYAIFGGAIYDSGAPLVVKDSKFYNNSGVGPGSAGTSSSQGGAILVMGENAGLDLKGSEFINNTADLGGAVAVSSGTTGTFAIDDCTFTENKANDEGGAIYGYTTDSPITVKDSKFNKNNAPYGGAISASSGTDLAVSGSEFTENTATYGGAILAGGDTTVSTSTFTDNSASAAYYSSAIHAFGDGNTLALSGNTIGTDERAQVYTQSGVSITSPLKVKILNNETVNIHMVPYDITAVVTDDMGNKVVNINFRFTVGGTEVQGISIGAATGVYKTTFTPTQTGEFVVSTNLADATLVETGVLKISRSLTDLANIIAAAEAGDEIILDGDYAYIPEFDADIINGIVIDKAITIKGAENANIINGSDLARLFKVTNGGDLTLDGVTIANGKADDGAGIYLESGAKLTATDSTFKDSTATYSGGAIYADGAEISLTNCVLDGNDVTDYTRNNDTGGAAIYGNSATLALVNTNVTNNGNKELDRTKGDLVNGVINLMNSDATVTACVFENNTGIYGGAITTQAPASAKTLTIDDCTFTANAAYTGGAVYVGPNVNFNIKESTFDANNKATGEGSPGYTSGGGAIQIIGAQGTIDNVIIKNSIATQGGAIGVESTLPVTIKDSTFESNTATSEGGAIYSSKNSDLTVTDCIFTDNDAPFGSAISNDGTLSLSGNTITGGSVVPIANYYGTIISTVNVVTLDGQDVVTATATNDVTAILKDDNGNAIIDKTLVLIVNGEEITTSYNKVTGIMTGSCTLTQPGTYAVTAKGIDADHTVAGNLVYTAGTFTELQNLINAAEAGATITLDHDITYNEAFDGDALKEGIAITKDVTIVGADGIEICGNELARVFKVSTAALTLKDITVCHGAADEGAGVYVENGATLKAEGATFIDNTAVTRGGAIYSEGTVDLKDSTLKENYISNRGGAGSENKGGAALFNKGGIATLDNVQVIDNVKDYENGHVLDGAIVAMGETTITNSYFKGNKGRYGGAIAQAETEETLTVKNTVFEDNLAIFGGAIYDEAGPLVVEGCTFNENSGIGPGSAGTSSSQGGAILVMGTTSSAEITDSTFTKNSADLGGAISISDGTTGTFTIDGCTFTENTATDEGGAIYGYTTDSPITVTDSEFNKNEAVYGGAISASYGTDLSVSDSTFTENTATLGGAVLGGGDTTVSGSTFTDNSASGAYFTSAIYVWGSGNTLALSDNTIGTDDKAQVYTQGGVNIVSPLKVVILNNETVNIHMSPYDLTAVLTDDNDNKVVGMAFRFTVDGTVVPGLSVDPATGVYTTEFTPTQTGEFVVSTNLQDKTNVATGVLVISRSLTDLANIIAAAEAGAEITLDGDYAYIPEFDADLVNGIVIDKVITIKGAEGADTISGSDLARLFKVVNGGELTLDGVTITDGKAADGAGIYLESGAKLTATDSTFKDNTATYSGGAIYADGAQISLTNCVLDGNDVTDYTKNNDTGGAAIYGQSSTIALVNTNVTNNGNKELDRTKGDLVNGVINLMNSDATVTGCVFENNTGIYGGAITTQAPAGAKTLTISESNFTANAAYTGGAVYVGDNVKFTIEDSIFDANNKATGEGSPGYTSGGGAIQLWHAGEGTIDNVTIKNSIATQGGAIGVEGSSPVTIKDSTFTDNTATSEGGAIYAFNYTVLTVTGSTFSGNTAPWGNAISNDGTLSLSGNTISTTSADIANYYGSIVSPISVSILGNDTTEGSGIVTAALGETVTITGVITDDNGNLIRDINFDYEVTNGDNIKEVHAVYNANTKQYEAEYVIENAGDHLVTITSDANTNLLINTGLYQVEKAQATLSVTVANIKEGEKAKVEVELIGVDDTGLAGQPITVRVNDVDYEITTGDDGKYSFEIDGLDTGRYDAVAVFEGNANYKLAFNSTIFDVKAEPGLSIFITDSKYGEHSYAIIALYSDGTLISGIVDITISGYDYPITVVCEDGGSAFNGYAEIPILPAGTYTYTATSRGTEDYLSVTTEPDTFTVSPGELTVDFEATQTVTGQPIAGTIEITDQYGENVKVTDVVVKIIKDGQTEPIAEIPIAEIDGIYNFAYDGELAPGKYTLVVSVPDQENYPAVSKEFELVVDAKSAQAGVDLGAIDITDGETTTVYITVGEGKVYAFTSYGDDDDEGPVYSTGTVLVLEEGDEWTKVVVLTNDADPSYVGREFYVESDDAFWHMKELFLDEGETGTGIYVRTHESGVVPQDIDGTATITIYGDDDGNVIQVIENVPITNGKGQQELPVLPIGTYYFTVTVDADGYDIAPAEFYDCLVVWVKEGTYTDLQQKINDAIREAQEDGRDAWLDLEYDFAFDEAYDLAHGINFVTIDGKITINGNGHTISGSDLARIFYVNEGASLEIMDVTLAHASVTDNGAAIYNLGELDIHDVTFQNNKVTQGTVWGPGAIAAGGAAIFSYTGSTLIVHNSEFLNNEAAHGAWNSFTCGAIYASGAEKVVIADSKFENNAAVLGGAITIEDYTVDEAGANSDDYEATIHGCDFNNNLAWQGGAINVNEKVPYLDIQNCNFNENKAVDPNSGSSTPCGGAICAGTNNYGTKLGLYNCNFEDNSAVSAGGAIILMNALCELGMNECHFNDNTATAGGAIYFYGESAEIHNSYFSGNDPEYGGALYIANGDVSIDYTNFDENTATQGGAIFVAKDAGLDLDHCNFYKNTADEGSAIYADYGSSLTMKECSFDENVATGNYGTVFLGSDNAVIDQTNFNNNKGGNGGAIFWTGDNGKVTNSNFWRNEATEGFSGGAIFAFGDNIEIDNCDFNENTAAVHGGAIAWINQGAIGGHEGTIINSRVNNNKAGNSGGAIYWAGESGTVDNCEFYNNEATANGAAIISTGSDMTIKDSRFDNNKAATDGAIYFAGNDADLIGDSFTNGQATMGAIVLDGASISVDKCFFEGNNGMPVHYNILNSGTIESITDTTFRFIDPNIELGDTYTYGDEIKMTGTFDWGVQQPAITMKYTINGVEDTATVLNGEYKILIDNQPDVGDYTLVISSFTDANGNLYEVNTAQATFSVVKATPILEVTADDDLMPGQDATIEITLTGAIKEGIKGIVIVNVAGNDYVVFTNENGEGELTLSGLVADKYPITATFVENDYYTEVVNDTEIIDFMMHAATFDIVIKDITYGEGLVVIVENVTDTDGNPLTGTVMGNIENADGQGAGLIVYIEDGSGTRTITGLNAGDYDVTATFADDYYEFVSETKEFTINVAKADSDLSIVYEDGTFNFTLDGVNGEKLNETLNLAIDAVPIDAAVTTENGTATYTDDSLKAGTYVISAVFEGNDNYLGSFDVLQFTVPKATPTLEISGDEYLMPGAEATIGITLTGALDEGIEGMVVVTVDGKDYIVYTDDNGEAELEIAGLVADEYPIFAKFIGNDYYTEVVNDTEIIDFMMHAATFDIVIEDITYGEGLVVIVENVTDTDGNPLTGTVMGNIENADGQGAGLVVNIVDGSGTRTITGLNAGDYDVTATFADPDYEFVSETKEFTINVAKADSDLSIRYEDGTFNFTLDGVNDEKLNETLSVAIDAVPIDAAITTDNGTATYDSTFDAGTYVVSAVFDGNDNYLGSFYVLQFTVPKQTPTVTVEDAQVEWGKTATIKVTVTDSEGMPIEGTAVVRVSWEVDGVDEYIDITEGAGEASFEISRLVAPGEYDVKVMFEGGRNYNDANATAKLTLTSPKDITVDVDVEAGDYGEDTNVTVTVKDKANEAVANAPVSVIVDNGEPISATTGEDGVATVKLEDLAAGDHNITVKVNDGVHTAAEEEVKVTVGPASGANIQFTATDVEYGNTYPIKITVVDADDLELDGKAIVVLDGNQIAEVDIVDGAGEYNITGLDVGNYYLEVIFNNDNYLPSSYGDKINVTRATPTVKVEDAEAEWGSPATIKVTVSDSEGMPIEGAAVVRVSWIVDGVDQYIDITEGSGEASFEISKLVAPGEYDVKVMFEGGRNYNDVNATAKLTLTAPKDLIVDVEVEAGNYGEDTNVTVTVTDKANTPVADAPVTVVVDGKEYKNVTTDENGTVTLPVSDLIAGDHNITVKVNDGVHDPAEQEVKVTIEPASGANIQFTATDVEYGNAYPIKITVTDAEDLDLDGKAIIVLDGNAIAEVDIVDGAGEYNITGLEVGNYYLEVIFNNDNYLPSTYGDKINVTRATPTVKVEDAEAEWGSPATIKVTVYDSEGMPIEGAAVVRVSWIVDGVDQYIDITEGSGEATFEISKLVVPGEYDVKVMFEGGRNYNDVNATAKLTLTAPKDLIVDVNVETGNYGEDTNVTVTVTDKANTPVADATVTVVVDGKEYKNVTTDENGTVTLPVSDLIAGDHNITVKVDDGEHTPTEETATATVEPASGADIQATVQPGHAGEDSIVNITAKGPEDEPLEGNAIVLVDGEPYTEVPLDENGTASVPIKNLPAGEHTVEVVFDNPNYLPSSYTTHFDVKAQDTKLDVSVDKENIVYGDGAVTATLDLSADGKPINGVVEVILNGDPQNVTVSNGKATVKFDDLAAGNYTVVANYAGTSVYSGATDSTNFNVARKATKFNYENMKTTAVNYNIDGRIGEYFYFQLLDEDGKALANKDVVIGFNGKTYNKTTNETGWARLQINLARAFRYTFAINFAGDENYTSAFNVALINVTTQTPKLTTSSKTYAASAKTKSLTATFKTKSGNAVSGRKITFTVNGKSYSAKTNAKGVATVKVSISKKGTYSFTAKFAGDDTYAAISKSAKLTIK